MVKYTNIGLSVWRDLFYFRSIDRKIFFRRRTKSDGAFFLISGGEALAKKVFFGAGKIREKLLAKSVGSGVFFKNEA